jgi:hypothetical protein
MYIRHQSDALNALAQILDLPERRQQIVQCTIKIMLCLDAEPRTLLSDCQALLIEDGLEALRRKRRDVLEHHESIPIIILDPEGDRLFEAAATSLDALRLAEVVRQVFPDLRHERWVVARALLAHEAEIRAQLAAAIKARGQCDVIRCARSSVESILAGSHPMWSDRAGSLRAACVDVLKGARLTDPDALHQDADLLFELFAVSDDRAAALLVALDQDPEDAVRQVARLYEALDAIRSLEAAAPARSQSNREAA